MIYTCEQCGRRYTRDFDECPNCGCYPLRPEYSAPKRKSTSPILVMVLGVILGIFIAFIGFMYVLFQVSKEQALVGVENVQTELDDSLRETISDYYRDNNLGSNNTTVEIESSSIEDNNDTFDEKLIIPEDTATQSNNKTKNWLQEFNNGDIQVKQAFLCPKYSEEAGKNLWEYTIVVEAKCKVKTNMYIHVFDDYKDHLNSQIITEKIDGSGWYTLSGTIYGTETWWYPDIYYFVLSDSEHFYDPDLMHTIAYNYDHPSAKN